MTAINLIGRRRFLAGVLGASAGLILPGVAELVVAPAAGADPLVVDGLLPFVDHYMTNVSANLTATTNSAVDILSDMALLWRTGTAWNNGTVIDRYVLRANMRHCIQITNGRTENEARTAFIYDRQDQSYAMIAGLGPLADLYYTGAKAVTSITSAPEGTPPTTVNDGVPPNAPAGAASGAGAVQSDLGAVVALVQTLRGDYSSGNPSKMGYQYPRPWRMTEDSEVVDTGLTDEYGYPIYKSEVIVAPQLLRQRSSTPDTDGGFPSGHTNAFFLAGLAYAYAVPERFQELITRAFELANTRIIAGMHSVVDVLGGRVLATALAAAILNDPANATTKAVARATALTYFEAKTGTKEDTLYDYAHSEGRNTDPYADPRANASLVAPLLTYDLPGSGRCRPMVVPKGAEVLLETRLPYLDAGQRRAVLRGTALPAGHPILDGPEMWGRLNLFAAADGYADFDRDVRVVMDADGGGFHAADAWRNDITGRGGLVKCGTGTLTLAGTNSYTGGTTVAGGTLLAGSGTALGRGDVTVAAGTLRLLGGDGEPVRVHGRYRQASSGILELEPARWHNALVVDGTATIEPRGRLIIRVDDAPAVGMFWIITAGSLVGRFDTIEVTDPRYEAVPLYTPIGLGIRITPRG